ncbi:MAG: GNAT family N-acetyltransferase [Anaerolineales bacterium]|nr:GNAT family N-acetyltransferase [Anaerolineales bacterium]
MPQIPTLTTERLILRPFTLQDAPAVKDLAGEYEIAATTANIPHPYEDGMAEEWINTHQDAFDKGEGVTFAIVRKADKQLIGAIGVHIYTINQLAEMGYWVGKPYWKQGYCTEAAREVIRYSFEQLGLNRVQARHMTKNPASGRVMQKVGMQYEGTLRQSLLRWETFEDAAMYSILRDEYGR